MSSPILWPELALPPINLYTAPLLAAAFTSVANQGNASKNVQPKAPASQLSIKSH